MLFVVGVPEIVLSAFWTLITVAKPAAEIESISVPAVAHFLIAAWNSCACWLLPVCSRNGEAMYMPSAPPAAAAITGGAPHGSMPISLPVKPTLLSALSTSPQPLGMSTYARSAPLDWTSAACGLGSGDVGDTRISLIDVTPAAFIHGGLCPEIDSSCGCEKYISATFLTPNVLPAITEAAALSPTLTDQNWIELGALNGTGVNGITPMCA